MTTAMTMRMVILTITPTTTATDMTTRMTTATPMRPIPMPTTRWGRARFTNRGRNRKRTLGFERLNRLGCGLVARDPRL